jgi:predicted RNase H-like HicB family nuclease
LNYGRDEVKAEIRAAIEFHLEGIREDGFPIPKPSSRAEYVEVGERAA